MNDKERFKISLSLSVLLSLSLFLSLFNAPLGPFSKAFESAEQSRRCWPTFHPLPSSQETSFTERDQRQTDRGRQRVCVCCDRESLCGRERVSVRKRKERRTKDSSSFPFVPFLSSESLSAPHRDHTQQHSERNSRVYPIHREPQKRRGRG